MGIAKKHKTFYDYLEAVDRSALESELWDACPFRDDPDFLALTPIQQKFVITYGVKDLRGWTLGNAYQWSSPTDCTRCGANMQGMRLMSHEKLKPFFKKWDKIFVERFSQSAERIMQEEQIIAYSDIMDYLDEDGLIKPEVLRTLPGSLTRAIAGIEVIELDGGFVKYKLKMWDKSAALSRIERVKGMNAPDKTILVGGLQEIPEGIDAREASKLYADLLKGGVE